MRHRSLWLRAALVAGEVRAPVEIAPVANGVSEAGRVSEAGEPAAESKAPPAP